MVLRTYWEARKMIKHSQIYIYTLHFDLVLIKDHRECLRKIIERRD